MLRCYEHPEAHTMSNVPTQSREPQPKVGRRWGIWGFSCPWSASIHPLNAFLIDGNSHRRYAILWRADVVLFGRTHPLPHYETGFGHPDPLMPHPVHGNRYSFVAGGGQKGRCGDDASVR
jgi:hypothetical protein